MSKSYAQDADNNHFIYIQAKAKQPFYVILNKKVYSSSSIGYLIIPKLKDGSYDLRIGFPQQQAPEQNFTCKVDGADAGYSLEKGENGQLGLLNLQTKKFIASSSQTTLEDQYAVKSPKSEASAVQNEAQESNNAFSEMLSDATGDPSLATLPKATGPAKVTPKTSTQVEDFGIDPQADSKAIAAAAPVEEQLVPATMVPADESKTYGVIKSGQGSSKAGTEMTFVMFNSNSTDTIKILVPRSEETKDEERTTGIAPTPITKKQSLALFTNTEEDSFNVDQKAERQRQRAEKREEKKFVDLGNSSENTSKEEEILGGVNNPFYDKSKADNQANVKAVATENKKRGDLETEVEGAGIANSAIQCDPISEKDFQKMQKKMIGRNNDNDMIEIVDKYIDGKCLTTSQVKTLGGLFLSDAGRFALFNDTYSHVTDKQNFPTLESQLLDSYFKKRFQQILQ